jgi:hypothetical protein
MIIIMTIIKISEYWLEIEFSGTITTRRKPHSKDNTTCKAKSKGPWRKQSCDGGSNFEDHVNEKI